MSEVWTCLCAVCSSLYDVWADVWLKHDLRRGVLHMWDHYPLYGPHETAIEYM